MSETTKDLVLSEGSVAVKVEGIKASGTITVANNAFDGGEILNINGVALTEGVEWTQGVDVDATAQDIADAINASTDRLIKEVVQATVALNVVTVLAVDAGDDGNLITMVETDGATDNLTLSGALLTGGIFCQGVYTPEEEGADFVAPLEDGLEFSPGRELLERTVRTSTTESEPSRVGIKSVTGTLPVELKAGSSEGAKPEWDKLMLAALGSRRISANAITTEAANTSTVLNIPTADLAYLNIGDTIKIKKIGILDQDHLSPITAKDTVLETVTILIPATDIAGNVVAIPDNAVIAPFVTYLVDSSKAPTLSIPNYVGGKIREKVTGARPTSLDINNYTTGQIGDMSFGLEGINLEKEVGTPLFSPVFDSSVPPVMLDAKVYQDAGEVLVNTFALNMANTVAFKTATGSKTGRIASRITKFVLTGSIDPYTEDDNVARFNTFDANSAFSLFARAYNPSEASPLDEKEEVVSFYVPNARMTEFTTGDQEGLATDAINFSGHRTNGNDTVFVSVV